MRAGGESEIGRERQPSFFRLYDRLAARAARLNPPQHKGAPAPRDLLEAKVPKPKRRKGPAPALVKRLREWQEEVLRFLTDLSVPFDNNGSERNLRMIKF